MTEIKLSADESHSHYCFDCEAYWCCLRMECLKLLEKPCYKHESTTLWHNQIYATNNYPKSGDGGCYDSPLDGWVCEIRTLRDGIVALAIGNDKKTVEANARLIANAWLRAVRNQV